MNVFQRVGLVAWVGLGILACGGPLESAEPEALIAGEEATQEASLSATVQGFALVERDARKCASPMCGGYFVRAPSYGSTAVYVRELDFSQSGLDDVSVQKVLEAPAGELLFKALLGPIDPASHTRALQVLAAWRGLPGLTRLSTETLYTVEDRNPAIRCITAPCPNLMAKRLLSILTPTPFSTVAVNRARKNLVSETWLLQQVEQREAIVSGRLRSGQKFPGGAEKVLDVSQIYLPIPQTMSFCPRFKLQQCPAGTTRTYSRNGDRCLLPDACVTPGMCAQYLPACSEGYSLTSWPAGQFGCPAFACDPTFVL